MNYHSTSKNDAGMILLKLLQNKQSQKNFLLSYATVRPPSIMKIMRLPENIPLQKMLQKTKCRKTEASERLPTRFRLQELNRERDTESLRLNGLLLSLY